MNKANLKSYAPKARLDFIKAVTERANVLGISAAGVVPAEVRGDVALIDGREWPAKVAGQRDELIARIKRHGFEQTMDEVAYTWFNRFAALRYMEIHDYLGHGWRVLSSRDGGLPEILRHASEVTLPGLSADRAREMQLAGNQDNELYKLLLVAQCNELSRVMPFLFERIDDETELLLPENLLRTDSIVAKLVEQVPEEDWQEIEVIGWLYQFYISEKKDQVIGKVVKSEDIPAATQLFTPNWIVQYLVQNSVGRLWLMANPTSTLASQWPYYIQPAEQTPDVQAQLDALIQTRVSRDGDTLDPEKVTMMDPACGSGHILVVAYDVLKAIYLERGYQPRAIPRLILEKNLFGLDIDDRAAQLAAFALLMKARADDRRLFNDPPSLNVRSLQDSKGLNEGEIADHLRPFGVTPPQLRTLVSAFECAKTYGSLISISSSVSEQLPAITAALQRALEVGDLYARQAAKDILPLAWQALVLGMEFDAVAANPPFMGSKGMNPELDKWLRKSYPDSRIDLMTCFMERCQTLTAPGGIWSMINLHTWMFLKSFKALREHLISHCTIESLTHVGRGLFGSDFGSVAFVVRNAAPNKAHIGSYRRLFSRNVEVTHVDEIGGRFLDPNLPVYEIPQVNFARIDGAPIAYWLPESLIEVFDKSPPMSSLAEARQGLSTSNNDRFLRFFWEVDSCKLFLGAKDDHEARASRATWFPHNKGGPYRKWAGNYELVVDWQDGGARIKEEVIRKYPYLNGNPNFVVHDDGFYFRESISWSEIGLEHPVVRYYPNGFTFNIKGMSAFPKEVGDTKAIMAFCNSNYVKEIASAINPTMSFGIGNFKTLPGAIVRSAEIDSNVSWLIDAAREDWDSSETSWNFKSLAILGEIQRPCLLTDAYEKLRTRWRTITLKMQALEEENNRIIIDFHGLNAALTSTVPLSDITLGCNPRYRYGGERGDDELDALLEADTLKELVSYVIGCAMGRYSLNTTGLVYARAGGEGFDPRLYGPQFPVDSDGIVPLTEEPWFEDDAGSRILKFLDVVLGSESLEKNLDYLASGLGKKRNELPIEAIRRYLADKFYKDHLQSYKRRPIYWLFSSGKQGAFQALVYLHRYNEGTLARMRAEYVVPLTAKMVSRLDMLDKDSGAASSAAARTKLQKQIELLRKRQIELLAYDEMLRHYADMRISLDLDAGVKVNYAKFGDLVAEPKVITGGGDE